MHLTPERESVLKGLNAFKAIAKQALLMAGNTENPDYWQRHAESRRQVYKELISQVEVEGVEAACANALNDFRVTIQINEDSPEHGGKLEALENFLTLCGFDEKAIKQSQRV